jgi:hypothetical protein
MNKIYLDKLCNFSLTTYKNYEFVNKNIDFNDYINNIKQNQSLNEKGIFLKHNFIELKTLIPNIEYDQMVLVNPLCFNLCGNIEWFNFLNAILTVLNDNYLHETNLIKKTILETADKTFRKKIIIDDKINDKIITQVCELTNITLILLLSQQKIKYFNNLGNIKNISKIVVMVNDGKEYFSVINWKQKYFSSNSEFINYLINDNDLNKMNIIEANNKEEQFINVSNKKKNKLNINDNVSTNMELKKNKIIKSTKQITKNKFSNNMFDFDNNEDEDEDKDVVVNNDNNKNAENKGKYEELQADENYALYISEVIDNTNKTTQKSITTDKKKKKNDKNIFVVNKDDDKKITKNTKQNHQVKDIMLKDDEKETSIFNKTEKISKKDIDEIYTNIKSSMGLETIQAHALKLGIAIFEGSTKSGKPKNKTKTELIEQIKEYVKNYQNK